MFVKVSIRFVKTSTKIENKLLFGNNNIIKKQLIDESHNFTHLINFTYDAEG